MTELPPNPTAEELELNWHLARACFFNDLPLCAEMLSEGAAINGVLPSRYHPQTFSRPRDHNRFSIPGNYTNGRSPLMIASNLGHADIASFLLDRGARVAQTTSKGLTPLHFAATTSSPDAVATLAILLNAGAPIDARAHFSETALEMAVYSYAPKPEAVGFLISRGASLIGIDMFSEALTIEYYAEPCQFPPGTSWSMDPTVRAMILAERERLALSKIATSAQARAPRSL